MAVTSLEVPFRADVVPWRPRRWPRLPRALLPFAIGLLVVGVLASGAARIAYAVTYQPLTFEGGTFGPTSAGLKPIGDGFETTRWLLTAKPGTTATFAYPITNTGSDPVTIYAIPELPDDWIYTSLAWAPTDELADPRSLPVVVPSHQAVELLLSIRKPVCPSTKGGRTEIDNLVYRYSAFGFSHTVIAPMVGRGLEPIELCWS